MSDVVSSVDGSIWQIEVNRPQRANALRRRTIRQIEAVLDAVETQGSDATRATGVVLTGDPERFSAGADLLELAG
ncbi:MAG: enoyl-CoA hydratase-related protein [bacterium]|nr:enoyl-CoA hydratase-related protein [bacterium]